VRAPKKSISLPPSNLPLLRRRRRHSVIARIGADAGAGADHDDVRLRMVRHQEALAERADHLHRVADLEVADVVARHAAHGRPWWSSSTRFTVIATLL
jgi:hypothetical protein